MSGGNLQHTTNLVIGVASWYYGLACNFEVVGSSLGYLSEEMATAAKPSVFSLYSSVFAYTFVKLTKEYAKQTNTRPQPPCLNKRAQLHVNPSG